MYKFILVKKTVLYLNLLKREKIRGRYTIIGFNPDKVFNIGKNKIVIDNFEKKIIKTNTLHYLNDLIKNFKVKSSSQLPGMSSMLVGYFSYDVIRLIEKIPDSCKKDINIPDIRLMRPKNLIIYDNLKKKFFIFKIYSRMKLLKIINLNILQYIKPLRSYRISVK